MNTRLQYKILLIVAIFCMIFSGKAHGATCQDLGGTCRSNVCAQGEIGVGGTGCAGLRCCAPITPTPINCADPAKGPLLSPSCAFKEIPKLIVFGVNLLLIGGGVLSLIFIIRGGFMYAMARDDPGQLEEARKTILWAFLGLVFASSVFVIMRVVTQAVNVNIYGLHPPSVVYAQSSSTDNEILVQVSGQISSATDGELIAGAKVTLYWFNNSNWEAWPAQNYRNQRNPYIADSFGQFKFFVPRGQYYYVVERMGSFRTESIKFTVETEPIDVDIKVKPAPAIWTVLLITGVPVFTITAVFFIVRAALQWQKKQMIRQRTLKKLQTKVE